MSVTNDRQFDLLFNNLFGLTTNKTSKLRIIVALWGEFTGDQWIPLHHMQNVLPGHLGKPGWPQSSTNAGLNLR